MWNCGTEEAPERTPVYIGELDKESGALASSTSAIWCAFGDSKFSPPCTFPPMTMTAPQVLIRWL